MISREYNTETSGIVKDIQIKSEYQTHNSIDSSKKNSRQFRTHSDLEREKDYNKFFTYLEEHNEEEEFNVINKQKSKPELFSVISDPNSGILKVINLNIKEKIISFRSSRQKDSKTQ